jgi:predicted CopG family antitoxin
MSLKTLRQIVVSRDNYNELKGLGSFGDSFNDVITKLLRNYRKNALQSESGFEPQDQIATMAEIQGVDYNDG